MLMCLLISGQEAVVQELQNTNRGKSFFSFCLCVDRKQFRIDCLLFLFCFFIFATVRKLAFSASLLASGEGNSESNGAHLIYKNVISNIGNNYNPHTGSSISLFLYEKIAFIIHHHSYK